ncbi:hypothetical protein [Microbacterium sp. CFBP9034]|uniref:hypothetical protein n=1 Tax=Microbacterium sp. CFBP9034 TaxID=3096540 RepID=UPI002A6A44DF|nr:hypothetical protein [Microbacterium sp. CFBP9034]MDY0910115.1 hypothetical protein [Microbacterium sp. CFBP9034]
MTVTDAGSVIEIDIDRYGQDARVSALADFLEIAALSRIRVTRAALADLIVDNEWARRPVRRYHLAEDMPEEADSWSDAVFRMIGDRGASLRDVYPFEERGRSVQLKSSACDPRESAYVALLAITAVHAWNLPCTVSVEATLEDLVARTLHALGMTVANIGVTDRGSGFLDALRQGAATLGLRAHPNPTPRSVRAKDIGVDTLAGVVWGDQRVAGQWLTLGQVTVAQSQYWPQKLNEPEAPRWADYLQELIHPQVFLAIPHHIQDDHLRNMMAGRRGLVIDRLRLAARMPSNTAAERTVIEALLASTVSGP